MGKKKGGFIKKRYSFFLVFITILSGLIYRVGGWPYYGEPFELAQPDGSLVPVVVWGDEFYQRVESPDGFTLIRNSEGWICYAELNSDSTELIPTNRIYQPAGGLPKTININGKELQRHLTIKRSARLEKHAEVRKKLLGMENDAAEPGILPAPPTNDDSSAIRPFPGVRPVTGSMTGLTILIDFSDQPATVPIDSIKDFVNKRGYTGFKNNGSVRDFFFDISGGKLDYQNIVVGYYRAKNPKTYYDSRSASFGTRAQELISEALNWLKNQNFDFSVLSTSSSGTSGTKTISAINVLYAGSPTQGWSQGLWPHQGRLNSRTSFNGIYASKYQMSNIGTSLKIGTFCHENGHMLFSWPDLYDYGGESAGVGVYCLMCANGSLNPIPPCAYLRDLAGWDAVTDITDMAQGTILTQRPADINKTFIYRNKSNTNEMFYIEARRRIGRYKTLPDSGFMIWHVDRRGSNDNQQRTATSHYLVSLEQADNLFELEANRNTGKAGDLFRKGYKDRFSDTTKPDGKWWNGSNSGIKIFNMSDVADTMSFSIGEITSNAYTILIYTGENGSAAPSGKISVTAGTTLKIAVLPDSGYQTDAITIDGNQTTVVDTIRLEKINGNHTIDIVFGLKGALSVISPRGNDILYAGDTFPIIWRTRGITLKGIDISYSIDAGKNFAVIKTGLPASDTVYKWIVPDVESNSCIIKVSDTDQDPSARSGVFSIKKKPSIVVSSDPLTLTVQAGKQIQHTLPIENKGSGELRISTTTGRQIRKVVINELFVGTGLPDAIEIANLGGDIDLSGWQIIWDDNKSTSGSYTFPDGFILKGGTVFLLSDSAGDTSASSAYMGVNVQWLYSDSLALSVTLLDPAGHGVDFVKSKGSPISPPEGVHWQIDDISLCNSYIMRGVSGNDTLPSWSCSNTGTLRKFNPSQKASSSKSLLSTTPLSSVISGSKKTNVNFTIDAAAVEPGTYIDTVLIYHNDLSKPLPIRIPCVINVVPESKVIARQVRYEKPPLSGTFVAGPNPAFAGERVFFQYRPFGNERSGNLIIYNSVGECVFSDEVDFSNVSVFDKEPLRFSWLPVGKNSVMLRYQTCVAKLIIKFSDGTKKVFSTNIGLR